MQRSPSETKGVIRFDVFEIDPVGGQLLKQGQRLKIQDLPFRLLVALLERPGVPVTREELRTRLWGDTIVDFDDGLHTAVRKLRDVLEDSAAHPRFVETIPRRGYRFMAPVIFVKAEEEERELPRHQPLESSTPVAPAPLAASQVVPKPNRRYLTFALAGIGVVVSAFLGAFLSRSSGFVSGPSEVLPITSYRGLQTSPSLSSDGTRVAFIWSGEAEDNLDVYVQNINGTGRVRLTTDPAPDRFPAWSPDGKTIAFVRSNAAFLVPAGGGAERKIATASGFGLSWSPDSRTIAFSDAEAPENSRRIFLVSVESGIRSRLTSSTASKNEDNWPSFSPDGQQVAFIRGATTMTDLYRTPVSGGKPTRVAIAGRPLTGLVWSPDGLYLLAASGKHAPGLFAVRADAQDSTTLERVDIAGSDVFQFSMARRVGGQIDLAYGHETLNSDILGLALDGESSPSTPLATSIRADQAPSFSPNGKMLAFCSARSGYEEIWSAMADGSQPRQLTHFNAGLASSPRWSPDGQSIVFDATINNNRDVYVVRYDGGPPRNITRENSSEGQPGWSHDGRWIYFMSDRSGSQQIWKAPEGGGTAIPLTNQGGYQALESADGKFLYYAKGQRTRGIYRIATNGGTEEALVSDRAWQNQWALANGGIYYFDSGAEGLSQLGTRVPLPIRRLDLKTQAITTVANLTAVFPYGVPVLDVRNDGKYLAWVTVRERSSELMLIRNLRLPK